MYYGQFLLDKFLHEEFFINKRNGFFVECGAVDGILESTCKFFEDELEWSGINIEASPPLFNMLIKNRPNCININVGLSDHDGVLKFSHAIHPSLGTRFGNGSFSHCKQHKDDLIRNGCHFEEYAVECKMFSSIFNNGEIDLFILDVEGHEINALKGIMSLSDNFLPKVFVIEHSFSGIDNIDKLVSNKYNKYSIQRQNAVYVRKF